MDNIKKLFLVRTKAVKAYVVSDGMDNAYAILRNWLDKRDYGISSDRELDSIDVLAVEKDYMVSSNQTLLLTGSHSSKEADGIVDDVIDG